MIIPNGVFGNKKLKNPSSRPASSFAEGGSEAQGRAQGAQLEEDWFPNPSISWKQVGEGRLTDLSVFRKPSWKLRKWAGVSCLYEKTKECRQDSHFEGYDGGHEGHELWKGPGKLWSAAPTWY